MWLCLVLSSYLADGCTFPWRTYGMGAYGSFCPAIWGGLEACGFVKHRSSQAGTQCSAVRAKSSPESAASVAPP
ncbi:hypothetical protein BD779DRAFT_407774 [Infundibulicybe gibba]|nr:hypothetical protein BD779DRAFT_407774 [Infundibulicybe gibba]